MIQKKLLGEIMAEMGFLSREQLEEALERQRRVLMDKMLPERLREGQIGFRGETHEGHYPNAGADAHGFGICDPGAN